MTVMNLWICIRVRLRDRENCQTSNKHWTIFRVKYTMRKSNSKRKTIKIKTSNQDISFSRSMMMASSCRIINSLRSLENQQPLSRRHQPQGFPRWCRVLHDQNKSMGLRLIHILLVDTIFTTCLRLLEQLMIKRRLHVNICVARWKFWNIWKMKNCQPSPKLNLKESICRKKTFTKAKKP